MTNDDVLLIETKDWVRTLTEIDDELAAMLTDRLAEFPSVEIVNGDATSLLIPRQPVLRHRVFHDAASRSDN